MLNFLFIKDIDKIKSFINKKFRLAIVHYIYNLHIMFI